MSRNEKYNMDGAINTEMVKCFSHEQNILLTWLSAVRILPLLSIGNGLFNYWDKRELQNYLYAVFNAIDSSSVTWDENSCITHHYNHYFDAIDVDTAADIIRANATAYNVVSTIAYISDIPYTRNHLHMIANAVNSAWECFDTVRGGLKKNKEYFSNILFDDVCKIEDMNFNDFSNDTYHLYNNVWQKFLHDLTAVGCGYWARLYANLFKNKFVIDENELDRRRRVPDEIIVEGAASVGQYLERLGSKIERLNEARIIILGEKGAGKTSLARKLLNINAELPRIDESTDGVETSLWRFSDEEGNDLNAHVWDFAGHSITHSAHRCFMSARCLYIYVYNGRIERDNDPTYWLEQARIYGGNAPVLFLINEKDGYKSDIEEKTLLKEYTSIKGFYRVNIGSEDTSHLEDFCQVVKKIVCTTPAWNNQIISLEAYKIKNELRKYFENTKTPHITREMFNDIAITNGAYEEQLTGILKDLHALGICLWYSEKQMGDINTLVLNPDWITNGIYKIINEGYNKQKHSLTISDGAKILQNDERYKYPKEKVKFIFELMRLYELAFFKTGSKIFVPGILPLDQPDNLPPFLTNDSSVLTMRFEVKKTMPPNIVSRIIVQRHSEVFNETLLWRKGAVLYYRKNKSQKSSSAIALIVDDGRSIIVQVKGDDKTEFIVSLRKTIQNIFDSYKLIKPNLMYTVFPPNRRREQDIESISSLEDAFELSEKIIKAFASQKQEYIDEYQNRVPLGYTVNLYKIDIHVHNNNQKNITNYDYSTHSIIEIRDCTLKLQDALVALARRLEKEGKGSTEYVGNVIAIMDNVQDIIDNSSTGDEISNELNKKGLIGKINDFRDKLSDKESDISKKITKLHDGTKRLQEIAKIYNDFAKLLPVLPQIPDIILNIGN